jgi:hypothetical protein
MEIKPGNADAKDFSVADVKKNFYFCNGKILIVKEKCIG